ncbi:tripartite motif-containing protein 46-like [Saccostrea cucullata]|uniref:tripartite motif-containing protein 46-like n=1 Tax=Saccostrea cuccullata TaxID=36930 RepID=UPI002ED28BAC
MYCKNCNIPICTKCIASDQHLGHKLSEVLKVLEERKDKLSKDHIELHEIIYPTYHKIASDVQNRMSKLEKEYRDLLTAITKHEEDWHREIDKLVKKLKAEVDERKTTQLQTLQKHLDEINETIIKIKEEIDLIDEVINSHEISKLFRNTFDVDKYRQLPLKTVLSPPSFTQGRINGEQLSKLFGTLSLTSILLEKNCYSMKETNHKSQEAGSSPFNSSCLVNQSLSPP